MKKLLGILALAGFSALGAQNADAADLDRTLGLIISGSYESWHGVDIVGDFTPSTEDEDLPEDDAYFTSGGEARLSLPAGEALSIQQDVKYELNSAHLDRGDPSDFDWYGFQWQATTHVSFLRNPDTGLVGIFGGFGGGKADAANNGVYFVGGEFQLYSGDWTFQGQGGYFDTRRLDGDNEFFRDAFFGRAVARWYMTPDSSLQFEVSYADGINDDEDDDPNDEFMLVEWGARYDTMIEGLPLVGDTNVFLRYRGHYAESDEVGPNDLDNDPESFTSHTILVGANWHFGGNSRMEHDRIGVALDSPDIVRWSQAGEVLD